MCSNASHHHPPNSSAVAIPLKSNRFACASVSAREPPDKRNKTKHNRLVTKRLERNQNLQLFLFTFQSQWSLDAMSQQEGVAWGTRASEDGVNCPVYFDKHPYGLKIWQMHKGSAVVSATQGSPTSATSLFNYVHDMGKAHAYKWHIFSRLAFVCPYPKCSLSRWHFKAHLICRWHVRPVKQVGNISLGRKLTWQTLDPALVFPKSHGSGWSCFNLYMDLGGKKGLWFYMCREAFFTVLCNTLITEKRNCFCRKGWRFEDSAHFCFHSLFERSCCRF